MRKRRYHCNGAVVCPVLLENMKDFKHSSEEEWMELQSIVSEDQNQIDLMEKRTARNLYVVLANPESHFCEARWCDPDTGAIEKCNGAPVIRRVKATQVWFVGCTDYYKHINKKLRKSHTFTSLRTFTDKARGYLQEMLTNQKPLVIPGDICEYVGVKKGRIRKRCAIHGETLVESGTSTSEQGKCEAVMILIEPVSQRDSSSQATVTYAICVGVHNHPPPPQPNSTEKKNNLFRSKAESAPTTTAAKLKLEIQTALYDGKPSPLQNLELSKNSMYRTMREIRMKSNPKDVHTLFDMVGMPEKPYVRDVRCLRYGKVFLLGNDNMLSHAAKVPVLAGDATYKTVIESNPHTETPEWYLYNIVAPHDPTCPTQHGIVVCRALMTSLRTEAYAALWSMFLKAIKELRARELGLHPNEVSINVPYLHMEPERLHNSITIRAVTTDFEAAEVEGIADAFEEIRGASRETHIMHLSRGCDVHFERAYKTRAASLNQNQKQAFMTACKGLMNAETVEQADIHFATVAGMDASWSSWLSKSFVTPLVSPAYSKMAKGDRMMALRNTNIAESQNRRGNLICGTGLDPVSCANKLCELDTISTALIPMGDGVRAQQIPRKRTRNGYILAQPGRKRSTGQKRSKPDTANTGKGKRRKDPGNIEEITIRNSSSNDAGKNEAMNEATVTKPSEENNKVIPTELSGSILWLHDELGTRCRNALDAGNEKLLVALSNLYSTVLECADLNRIKFHILSTIRKQGVDKNIISEFTDLLVLTTKNSPPLRQKATNEKALGGPAGVLIVKKEENKEDEDGPAQTSDEGEEVVFIG